MKPEDRFKLELTERQIIELLWWHDSDIARWENSKLPEPYLGMIKNCPLRKLLENKLEQISKYKTTVAGVKKYLTLVRNNEAKNNEKIT